MIGRLRPPAIRPAWMRHRRHPDQWRALRRRRERQGCGLAVVPDSGTDQLVGLAGMMVIDIAGGEHSYEFEYTLANVP